jgi:hypothetical protein
MNPPVARLAHLDAGVVPYPPHGDWKDLIGAVGGAMALARENSGDLNVGHAVASKLEHSLAHFHPSRELGDGVDLHLDFEIGHGATAPDDSDQGNIAFAAVEHDLFDQTPQQRLTVSIRGSRVSPDLWKATGEPDNLISQRLAHPI